MADLMPERWGHFRLESGHHTRLWLDLDTLVTRPKHTRRLAGELASHLAEYRVDAVCGPLTGGAFLAQFVAVELAVEFGYTERLATPAADPARYRLPHSLRPVVAGKCVAVVDDAISAGSAVTATVAELLACGAQLVAVGAVLVLGDSADRLVSEWGVPLVALARRPFDLWPPSDCPLCAAGVPLDDPNR